MLDPRCLRVIQVPTLLMVGTHDVMLPAHVEQMGALIPEAEVAVVEGGHGTYLGEVCDPFDAKVVAATIARIDAFLAQ